MTQKVTQLYSGLKPSVVLSVCVGATHTLAILNCFREVLRLVLDNLRRDLAQHEVG